MEDLADNINKRSRLNATPSMTYIYTDREEIRASVGLGTEILALIASLVQRKITTCLPQSSSKGSPSIPKSVAYGVRLLLMNVRGPEQATPVDEGTG